MDNESVFWKIAIPVIIALLAGGTSPWWWQEFFAEQPKTEPSVSNPTEPEPTASASPTPAPVSPDPAPPDTPAILDRASISIAYTGDYYGCRLPVEISIGDRSLYPSGSGYSFVYNDVAVGQQPYQIEGQIQCPSVGNCQAFGNGSINVIPGNEYYIRWQNVAVGQCSVILQ